MALSNIFNEPRREITESAIGLLALSAVGFGAYYFAAWLYKETDTPTVSGIPIILGILIFIMTVLIVVPLVFLFTHWFGEMFCDLLASFKLDPRPKNREGKLGSFTRR